MNTPGFRPLSNPGTGETYAFEVDGGSHGRFGMSWCLEPEGTVTEPSIRAGRSGSTSALARCASDRRVRAGRSGRRADHDPVGYETTVVGRVALNMLKSRNRRREHYVGSWLPEPVVTPSDYATDPRHEAELADAVGLALLVVLDTLAPEGPADLCAARHVRRPVRRDRGDRRESTPDAARQMGQPRARRKVRGVAGCRPRPRPAARARRRVPGSRPRRRLRCSGLRARSRCRLPSGCRDEPASTAPDRRRRGRCVWRSTAGGRSRRWPDRPWSTAPPASSCRQAIVSSACAGSPSAAIASRRSISSPTLRSCAGLRGCTRAGANERMRPANHLGWSSGIRV